jgi:hypothetical protein
MTHRKPSRPQKADYTSVGVLGRRRARRARAGRIADDRVCVTHRWREMDSNHRYLEDKLPLETDFVACITGKSGLELRRKRVGKLRV